MLPLVVSDIASGAWGGGGVGAKGRISGLVKCNIVLLLPAARHRCDVISVNPDAKSREYMRLPVQQRFYLTVPLPSTKMLV